MVRNRILALWVTMKALLAGATLKLAKLAPRSASGPGMAALLDQIEHNLAGAEDRAQLGLGTILAAFAVVIAAFVVLIVVDQFDASLGTPSSGSLSTAQNDILTGFGDMASLIQPLLLIAIGVVIIGLIRRIQ